METHEQAAPRTAGIPRSCWVFGVALVAYVGLITGQRDNHWQADAWEHHRGVRAISRNLLERRNPTYATDDGTPRYGPYLVALGALSRWSGVDPFHALSIGAIANTVLLVGGIAWFVTAIGLPGAANALLVVMVSLYGSIPRTTNSYALADLPWHQVNPSACAFALTLFAWGFFFQFQRRAAIWKWPAQVLLVSFVMLTHGLTGAFCFFGMFCFAAFASPPHRVRLLGTAFVLAALVVGVCVLWPWYDFLTVARTRPVDLQYSDDWYSPGLVKLALFNWSAPAIVCAACAFRFWSHPVLRASVIAGALAWMISIVGLATRTPVLGRLPIPSIFFWHLPAAMFVYMAGMLDARRWWLRIRDLLVERQDVAPDRVLELIVLGAIAWCLVPQVFEIVKQPYLARAYVVRLFPKREDKQLNLRGTYAELLRPISEGDVVLSDDITAWPVPAYGGRIVSALHDELLVPDQLDRERDVQAFLAPTTSDERRDEIIDRYRVKWIILSRKQTAPEAMVAISRRYQMVREVGGLVLLKVEDTSSR